MQVQTETRKLNELKVTNPYLRLGTDVSDLEKSISTVGLIAPLVISIDNILLAGARRYQALLNLGFTHTPVIVMSKNELEKELISIDENLVRKDLSKIEIEGHLRRAKEIYQMVNPYQASHSLEDEDNNSNNKEIQNEKTTLPAEKFLNIIAEKTGLSPKQIHEAITRDEMASTEVKEARQAGELSISQTNEFVKLTKEEQKKSLNHIKTLPVREVRNFVKLAKTQGVEEALRGTTKLPHAREFNEIEMMLKRLAKKLKQLELEGITLENFPQNIQNTFNQVIKYSTDLSENNLISDNIYKKNNYHKETETKGTLN